MSYATRLNKKNKNGIIGFFVFTPWKYSRIESRRNVLFNDSCHSHTHIHLIMTLRKIFIVYLSNIKF